MKTTRAFASLTLSFCIAMPAQAHHIRYSPSENPYPLGRYIATDRTECDSAASHAYDPMRTVISGVEFSAIDPDLADTACRELANAIIAKYKTMKPVSTPDRRELRAIFQMSRVIAKQGDNAAALVYTQKAYDLGYPFATYYLSETYQNGWGVAQDTDKAAAYLAEAIANHIPAAFLTRAKKELLKKNPNFDQIKTDLNRAREGSLPVLLTWSRFHEKFGEHLLRASGEIHHDNVECVVKDCGDDVAKLSEQELIVSFPYEGLISYQSQLTAALTFIDEYLIEHPDADYAKKSHRRITGIRDRLNYAIKHQRNMLR